MKNKAGAQVLQKIVFIAENIKISYIATRKPILQT
jgi:hypothetical protein